jgi:Arc/MetJ-type ribon-helix-helix transcriptional regulator
MKEITLKVPDHKIDFILELIEQLGVEVSEEIKIPEEHKEIVRERIQKSNANPERLLNWDEVKDNFKLD